jgi:hypothetical protein
VPSVCRSIRGRGGEGPTDGPAVDGVAVDGVAVDGVAVDGVAVVGAKDGTEQRSARVKPSTTRGLDAFVGAVSNTRVTDE